MARPKTSHPRKRLNLDIPAKTYDKVVALRDRTEAESLTEIVRRSTSLLEFAVDAKERGARFIIRNFDGTEREIVIA